MTGLAEECVVVVPHRKLAVFRLALFRWLLITVVYTMYNFEQRSKRIKIFLDLPLCPLLARLGVMRTVSFKIDRWTSTMNDDFFIITNFKNIYLKMFYPDSSRRIHE